MEKKLFNDVIIRQAFGAGIPLIDLRLTCNQPQDYANAIEPSSVGGEKIVNVIMNLVLEHNFQKPYIALLTLVRYSSRNGQTSYEYLSEILENKHKRSRFSKSLYVLAPMERKIFLTFDQQFSRLIKIG